MKPSIEERGGKISLSTYLSTHSRHHLFIHPSIHPSSKLHKEGTSFCLEAFVVALVFSPLSSATWLID